MSYTSGRLILATSNSWRRFVADRGGPVCEPITQRDGHPDLHFRNGGPDGPDARRMVACWNAAAGITTQSLEAVPDLVAAGIKSVQSVEAQRDALIVVLANLYDAVQRGDFDTSGVESSPEAVAARNTLFKYGAAFDEFLRRVRPPS